MICGLCRRFFSNSVSNTGEGRICEARPLKKAKGKASVDYVKQESQACQDFNRADHFYCPSRECFVALKSCVKYRRDPEEEECRGCEFGRKVVLAIRGKK